MSQTYDISLNPEKSIIIETEISAGTTDYERLKNLPSINGVELKGDLSTEDLKIDLPDTSNFATKEDLETKADKSEIPDVKEFATKIELEQATINKADKSEIPDVSEFATKSDVENKADKSEIPTKVSAFENDAGYLTEHQDISGLATKDELNDYALKADVPKKTSDLINDSDFITSEAVKNTVKLLDDEHKNILLSNGTYDGKDVEDGFVFTSPDGKLVGFDKTLNPGGDWGTSSQTAQEYVETQGVYGNGAIIILAGIYNTVNKSIDKGTTWTRHTGISFSIANPSPGNKMCCFNGQQFVGLSGKTLRTATDGVSWTSHQTNLADSAGIAFRNGRYVTREGVAIKYSDDGLNWSTANVGITLGTDYSLSASDDGFMFVGGQYIVRSTDGENWGVYSKPSGNGRQCAGGNGTWVIVDSVPTSNSSNKVFYSKDNGATWNTTYTPSQRIWSGLSWCGDRFFMVGYNSDVYVYSFDGVTWIEGKMPASAKWYTVTYADGTIVVTTKTQTNVAYASFQPFYEYSLTDLSFNKAEVEENYALKSDIPPEIDTSKFLQNQADESWSQSIGVGTSTDPAIINQYAATAIGADSEALGNQSVAFGTTAKAKAHYSTAVGALSEAREENSVAIGRFSIANAENSAQVGYGQNNNPGTFQFRNWTLVDSNGNIPLERLRNVPKTTISELTAQTTLANNAIFRANEISSVELFIPETIEDDFICEVDFTSGSTATAFTMVDTVKWTGDDITDGAFVPVGNKRYNLIFWYDGVGLNAVSRGVE